MSSDPLEQMVEAEERDAITGAISRLPERERLVLRMVAIEGFQDDDVSGCLGLRHREVREALERARKMLQRSICRSARD